MELEETVPEAPAVPVRYAGFLLRMWASVVDSIVIGVLLMPLAWVVKRVMFANVDLAAVSRELQAKVDAHEITLPSQMVEFYMSHGVLGSVAVSNLIQMLVAAVLVVWCWSKLSATPGKMLFRMKIADATTFSHPTNTQLIVRYLGYFVSILSLGLGFIWIAVDRRKQGWHDKMAGTVVLDQRKSWFGRKRAA